MAMTKTYLTREEAEKIVESVTDYDDPEIHEETVENMKRPEQDEDRRFYVSAYHPETGKKMVWNRKINQFEPVD